MLSDEEKKAIKEVKHFNQLTRYWQEEEYEEKEIAEYITTILNLIEKQSKEIEELSDKLTQKICKGVEEEILEKYRQTILSKDKEIEGLKEDNKKKSIVIIEYQDLYEKLVDKIKAKIEEVDYKMIAHQDVREAVKQVLQSLLEKE